MGYWAVFVLGALAVCGSVRADLPTTAAPEKVVRFRLQGEPLTLDWNLAHTPYETHLLVNLMEGLVRLPANLKPEPALATSWKIDEDGKRYTFTLREGVKWSDGVALHAQQFVDSWKRVLSPVTAAPYAYFLFDVAGAEDYQAGRLKDFAQVGVRAVDARTLEVRLKHPVAYWIQLPSFWISFPIRLDLIERYGVGWDRPGKMVSLGPFLLQQYDSGKAYTLVANPAYYGGKPAIDRLVAEIYEKPEAAVEKFQQGLLELVPQLGTASFAVESDPGLSAQLRKDTYLQTFYLGFNATRFPTQKAELRRAIALALPRDAYLKTELVAGQTAGSFVPPGLVGHEAKGGLQYSLDRARQELRAAGLSSATLPEMELLCVESSAGQALAKWVAQQLLKGLGLKIRVSPLPLKTYVLKRQLKTAELYVGSWGADFADSDNFLSVFQGNSSNNHTGWKDAEFDSWLDEARTRRDERERKTRYEKAQRRLQEEAAVVVPLYYDVNETLVAPALTGVEINPLNQIFFRKAQLR